MDDETRRRLAENEARFRDANEQIGRKAVELELDAPVPFVCECARPACTELAMLTLAEYESVRSAPATFLLVPGHEDVAADTGRVVGQTERFVLVEKLGAAGEVARALDPRSRAS